MFITDILQYRSLAVVGLAKNTGKTVTLNYILRGLHDRKKKCLVTSIGVDGEQQDSVYATSKPEITLYEGMRLVTSEVHYNHRQLLSEIVATSEWHTAMGRLVTANVLQRGQVILSGPATTERLRQIIAAQRDDASISCTIIDGALSRLSLASPTVTEAMVLATGAAVSPSLPQLISKTRFVFNLINLDVVDSWLVDCLSGITSGVWAIDNQNQLHDLELPSVFLLSQMGDKLFEYGNRFYVPGAVTDRLLKSLTNSRRPAQLIVRDFTKLFITPEVYAAFCGMGGSVQVLQRSRLIAVTLNPTSPQGYTLNSEKACMAMSEALGIPVYDVKQCEKQD
ncbi:MAG: hypothetical protein KBT04_05730 [Bacteroidales bacterium]|nr:hypothetical protein [Candidatus Colimorpha onthohippi]